MHNSVPHTVLGHKDGDMDKAGVPALPSSSSSQSGVFEPEFA